jgi:hypothetical protein
MQKIIFIVAIFFILFILFNNSNKKENYENKKNIVSSNTTGGSKDNMIKSIFNFITNTNNNESPKIEAIPPPPQGRNISDYCNMSEWSKWSNCSKTCGGGTQKRTRTIKEKITGVECGALSESRACNEQVCLRDRSTYKKAKSQQNQRRERKHTKCPDVTEYCANVCAGNVASLPEGQFYPRTQSQGGCTLPSCGICEEYKLSKLNSLSCPNGYSIIKQQDECMKASKALKIETQSAAISNDAEWPGGCYLWNQSNPQRSYYNSNSGSTNYLNKSNNIDSTNLICKKSPVNCKMSEWSGWSSQCAAGEYQKSRTKKIIIPGHYGGNKCGITRVQERCPSPPMM